MLRKAMRAGKKFLSRSACPAPNVVRICARLALAPGTKDVPVPGAEEVARDRIREEVA